MDFQIFFAKKLKESGLTLKKLSELSGISLKHLENMNSGNWNNLPPAPYLRGYFLKLGQILEFNGEELWGYFQKETEVSISGPNDTLPKNRFVKKSSLKKIWLIVIAVIILGFLGYRLPKILGRPQVTVFSPADETTIITSSTYTLSGKILNGDKLTIYQNSADNGEVVGLANDGTWQKDILLQPGPNQINIIGSKFLGRQTEVIRQIIFDEQKGTSSLKNIDSQSSSTLTSSTPSST